MQGRSLPRQEESLCILNITNESQKQRPQGAAKVTKNFNAWSIYVVIQNDKTKEHRGIHNHVAQNERNRHIEGFQNQQTLRYSIKVL